MRSFRLKLAVLVLCGALCACGKKSGSSSSSDSEQPAPAGPEAPADSTATHTGSDASPLADAGKLTLVKDPGLAIKARHPFDLRKKELRFVPDDAGYKVSVHDLVTAEDKGQKLTAGKTTSGFNFSFERPLPFQFPFAGETWPKVYANAKGNLTFGDPEYKLYAKRDPWADGSLRSVAAAINLLSLEGKDRLIAGLWDLYKDADIYYRETSTTALFTWVAKKHGWYKAKSTTGYADDSVTNVFQIRLHQDGRIDLIYPDVSGDVGIVGVFNGQSPGTSTLIDESTEVSYNGSHAKVRIKALRVFNEGSTVRFQYEMEQVVEQTETTGSRSYRIWLDDGRAHCKEFGATIASGITGSSCGVAPRIVKASVDGPFVDLVVSKEKFGEEDAFKISGDVVWWGGPAGAFSQINLDKPREITAAALAPLTLDLSESDGQVFQGNAYEVFHETVLSRDGFDTLGPLAQDHEMDEDFALSFTDFPLDDLFGATPSTGALNVKIEGIGSRQASPQDVSAYGFPKLQVTTNVMAATDPIHLAEGIDVYNYAWKNYGPALHLYQHEILHRWGMHLSFVHPVTKQNVALNDGDGHWLKGLDTRSAHKVWERYATEEYVEHSPMGGAVWTENEDGTFTPSYRPANAPGGLSHLDLYVLGLIPASEVPDLTLIEDLKDLGNGQFSGKKLKIKMADVVAASGERDPPASSAQREFKLSGYLVHEGNGPKAEAKQRVEDILAELRKLFHASSGGRMTVR